MEDYQIRCPRPVHSFDLNEEPPIFIDLNKKRKVPHEPVDLPSSKHKFRDRSCGSQNESLTDKIVGGDDDDAMLSDSAEKLEDRTATDNPLRPLESEIDSNSFSGGYSASMTGDTGSQTETLSLKLSLQDQPSTSYDSCNNTTLRNMININPSSRKVRSMYGSELEEDELEFEPLTDHLTSDSESNDIVEDAVEETDCNSTPSNVSTLSSDQKVVAKKPTIDQEFEQYFSMLML